MSKRKPNGYWTLERCMEDAAQYSSRSEWNRNSGAAYRKARLSGWLEQCCEHMQVFHGKWSLELCMESAAKYQHISDWQRGDCAAYKAAYKAGWKDACTAHMTPKPVVNSGQFSKGHSLNNVKWDLEACMAEALKYRTSSEWFQCGNASAQVASRNGWMEQCGQHFTSPVAAHGTWTSLDACLQDALQYNTLREWREASGGAVMAAYRGGWIEQCTAHMERAGGSDNDVVYIWRDDVTGLHKVGITSDRLGEYRIGGNNADMDPRIVFMLKVADARAVESKLLELGTAPDLNSSIDGYTEFRRLTDAELGQAVSIAYEAALAA